MASTDTQHCFLIWGHPFLWNFIYLLNQIQEDSERVHERETGTKEQLSHFQEGEPSLCQDLHPRRKKPTLQTLKSLLLRKRIITGYVVKVGEENICRMGHSNKFALAAWYLGGISCYAFKLAINRELLICHDYNCVSLTAWVKESMAENFTVSLPWQ